MKMGEYLQKKQDIKQKSESDRLKELEEAERKAREIRESLKADKKKEFQEKIHNFSILGMSFRPWTLNDMVIVLAVLLIFVVGGLSFMPSEKVTSDTNPDNEGFFDKLFGGFAVKSVTETTSQDNDTETSGSTETNQQESSGNANTETSSSDANNEADLVNFDMDVKYQDSSFTTINITNTNYIWYTLVLSNRESYPIKCDIKHYVNDNLKSDQSTINVEADNSREVNIRELASDTVNTLSRVKLEIDCSDGVNSATQNTKVQHLKVYFS